MILKLRVCVKPDLTLIKEKKKVKYGEVFEVDENRGKEILKATYYGKPVAEVVADEKENKNCSNK